MHLNVLVERFVQSIGRLCRVRLGCELHVPTGSWCEDFCFHIVFSFLKKTFCILYISEYRRYIAARR
eukprot:COSAG02_NODE_9647_length_2152_cov_2.011203_1_plen_66_part_10